MTTEQDIMYRRWLADYVYEANIASTTRDWSRFNSVLKQIRDLVKEIDYFKERK